VTRSIFAPALTQVNRPECEAHNRRAINFFRRSIQSGEDYLKETNDDVSMIATLAWAYCGKFTCLHRLLVNITQSEPLRNAEQVYAVFQQVAPISAQTSLNILFKTLLTSPRSADQNDISAIRKVAGQITDLVFQDAQSAKDREDQIDYILRWHDERDWPALTEKPGGAEEKYEQYVGSATLKCGDYVSKVYSAIAEMTSVIVSAVRPVEFERFAERAGWIVERDEALTACERGFNDLWQREEEHYRAECAYGFACLKSIQGKEQEAILDLENSLNLIVPSLAIHQRAEFDEDLDSIRRASDFRKLLYGSA
jgi:hypothetical protein